MIWKRLLATGLAALLITSALPTPASAQEDLTLEKGDHVSLIGNLLAERMQHDGWLETLVQSRFPNHQLVFRNLGFSGDEVNQRLRSENFGSPDDWLKRNETDVVIAFFGYGESFAGEEGLDSFKAELEKFIKHTKEQEYNGKSSPQIVLVSPIAYEDLNDPNLPDAAERNDRLELYTDAMGEVAKAEKVAFVDLFRPSLKRFEESEEPLTINGHYLNEAGNRFVAETLVKGLLPGSSAGQPDEEALEKLRQAVVDKNFYWFHRYRTTDGYNVFGGRSKLAYTDGVANLEVMQREMDILDAMTSNRDKRVWAVAQGEDLEVDDSNTPDFLPVKTNMPGSGPDGEHEFLGGEEAIEKMTVAKGMKVELFASEEDFPELINPVQMAFDPKGRLWVATWPSYPHWKPKDKMNDRLLILEDTNGDGKADKVTTFADGLHNPTGFEFWGGGVLVAMAPDLLFLKDTDGDDKADVRTKVLHGLDSADTHHTANSFVVAPDGWLYFQEGTFHQSQIESVDGVHRNNNAAVWRFNPRTWQVERHIPYNFANPHGHVFDRWGQNIVHDGTNSNPYHAAVFSGFIQYPRKHPQPPLVYEKRTRPCPATEILSSRHFPEELQGNLLVGNVIGFQGILQYRLEDDGSSFKGIEVEPIIFSSDRNFRPADIEMAPDGSLYFTDWQNPIIGHMQHHIRDPNRDVEHGRVYRITFEGRDLVDPPTIDGAPIEDLLDLLKSPDDRIRYRTRIELSGRDSEKVIAAAQDWLANLDKNDSEYEHHRLETLWLHQQHNVVNEELLNAVLQSPDFRARAAAVRVLTDWRERLSEPLETLKELAGDDHPRVRLEALRAASFFVDDPEAIEVPFLTLEHETDKYLDFTRDQTLRALED